MAADVELAEYLEDQALGTVGTTIFWGQMPAGVTNAIAVTLYPGRAPEHACGSNGMTIEKPRLQIRVRNTDENTARTTAKNVAVALSKVANQNIESVYYRSVMLLQSPGLMERDDNRHVVYGFNVEAEKAPS